VISIGLVSKKVKSFSHLDNCLNVKKLKKVLPDLDKCPKSAKLKAIYYEKKRIG